VDEEKDTKRRRRRVRHWLAAVMPSDEDERDDNAPGAAVHSAVLSTTGKGRIMIKPQAGSRDQRDGCDRRFAMREEVRRPGGA
jgi:hypothetical protein